MKSTKEETLILLQWCVLCECVCGNKTCVHACSTCACERAMLRVRVCMCEHTINTLSKPEVVDTMRINCEK